MPDRATLPRPAPAAQSRSCEAAFPGRADQVGQTRALLDAFLHGEPAADNAVLLASELAANAVSHSASGQPGGTFTVRAQLTSTGIYAEVEDQGSSWDGNLSDATAPHGLFLLRALSTSCGAQHRPAGWVTWFTLATDPPAGRLQP
jgi:hypothetical protein